MSLSIIVAMAHNNVIGADNALPWHLPADLKYFKATTMAKPIIMGRKTYQSIGRPLPGRRNIVITRDQTWFAEGVEVVTSVEEAVNQTKGIDEAMVIGGAQIYGAMLPFVERLYVTEIDKQVVGDTYFPAIDKSDWSEVSRSCHDAEGDAPAHALVIYDRS